MDKIRETLSEDDLEQMLRARDIMPTNQRVAIARVLFREPDHFSAEQVYARVNQTAATVSKATVYNTLGLFVTKGLVREVLVDPTKVFYDSNTAAHYHLYDIEDGRLTDIDVDAVTVSGLPEPPPDREVDGVDVIIRMRRRR